jgi:hypothetical protein
MSLKITRTHLRSQCAISRVRGEADGLSRCWTNAEAPGGLWEQYDELDRLIRSLEQQPQAQAQEAQEAQEGAQQEGAQEGAQEAQPDTEDDVIVEPIFQPADAKPRSRCSQEHSGMGSGSTAAWVALVPVLAAAWHMLTPKSLA